MSSRLVSTSFRFHIADTRYGASSARKDLHPRCVQLLTSIWLRPSLAALKQWWCWRMSCQLQRGVAEPARPFLRKVTFSKIKSYFWLAISMKVFHKIKVIILKISANYDKIQMKLIRRDSHKISKKNYVYFCLCMFVCCPEWLLGFFLWWLPPTNQNAPFTMVSELVTWPRTSRLLMRQLEKSVLMTFSDTSLYGSIWKNTSQNLLVTFFPSSVFSSPVFNAILRFFVILGVNLNTAIVSFLFVIVSTWFCCFYVTVKFFSLFSLTNHFSASLCCQPLWNLPALRSDSQSDLSVMSWSASWLKAELWLDKHSWKLDWLNRPLIVARGAKGKLRIVAYH